MIVTTKLATAVAAGVLGLAVTGAAAFAAFEPSAPATSTATVAGGSTAAQSDNVTPADNTSQTDKAGAHDRVKDVLDKLVANGTITQAQEDSILAALKGARKDNAGHRGALKQVLGGLFKMSADYLGVAPKDLRSRLANGQSLGQIANAAGNGKSRDGLIAALTTGVSSAIDKAVADGKITADQATKIKGELPTRIAKFVDHVFKAKAST